MKQRCCRDKQVRAGGRIKGPERIHGRTFPGSVLVNSLEEQLPCLHTLGGAESDLHDVEKNVGHKMKAKCIESDILGTFQLRHNRVSVLVTSAVNFPVLGNQPSPENSACCHNTVTAATCLI